MRLGKSRALRGVMVTLVASVGLGAPAAGAALNPIEHAVVASGGDVDANQIDDQGRLYEAGGFGWVGPRTGGALQLTEASDQQAEGTPLFDGAAYASLSDGSGGFYVAGDLRQIGTAKQPYLAHLKADGTLDAAFAPQLDAPAYSMALNGNKLVIAGTFKTVGGVARAGLAAVDRATGALDTTFAPPAATNISDLAAAGGSVYVGGFFANYAGHQGIVKLTSIGAPDPAFTASVEGGVSAVEVVGNSVFVGGTFSGVTNGMTTAPRTRLAQLDATTGEPTAWNPAPNNTVNALVANAAGTVLYAGGSFKSLAGQGGDSLPQSRVAKFALSGAAPALDGSFAPAETLWDVLSIALGSNGLYVGGLTGGHLVGNVARNGVTRLDTTTGKDDAWTPRPGGTVSTVAVSGTRVFVGGDFTSAGAQLREQPLLLRYNADGTLDTTFKPDMAGFGSRVNDIEVSKDGVYAIGSSKIGRFGLDGSKGWQVPIQRSGYALAIDGPHLYVGGFFDSIGAVAVRKIGRLDIATGAPDSTWLPPNPGRTVSTIVVSGDFVYAGGQGFTFGTAPAVPSDLARFAKSNAARDESFVSDTDGGVSVLRATAGAVYVAGSFGTLAGTPLPGIARVPTGPGATGAPDSWRSAVGTDTTNGFVSALHLRGDTLFLGGDLTGNARLASVSTTDGAKLDLGFVPDPVLEVYSIDSSKLLLATGGYKPGAAQEQVLTYDAGPPTVTITSPAANAVYQPGQKVTATYSCADDLAGVATCEGTVANGAAIDTSPGEHTFAVKTSDTLGQGKTETVKYRVATPDVTKPLALTLTGKGKQKLGKKRLLRVTLTATANSKATLKIQVKPKRGKARKAKPVTVALVANKAKSIAVKLPKRLRVKGVATVQATASDGTTTATAKALKVKVKR